MEVKILTPTKKLFEGKCQKISFFGVEGKFEILKNHAPLFALLKKGEIVIDGNQKISILSGIVKVAQNKIVALVKET